MNLGYVILYVRDLDKAKTFYTDTLGLTVVEAHSGPAFVSLRTANGSWIALQDKAAGQFPPKDEQPGAVELSFEAEDVDGTYRQWKAAGVEIVAEPMDMPFGRYFMAKDPEGYHLSVYRFNQPGS